MRFLGLGLSDRVPDAKTVWLFRERLTRAGAIDDLFSKGLLDKANGASTVWADTAQHPKPEIRQKADQSTVLRSLHVSA